MSQVARNTAPPTRDSNTMTSAMYGALGIKLHGISRRRATGSGQPPTTYAKVQLWRS